MKKSLILIVGGIILIVGLILIFSLKPNSSPKFVEGEEILIVQILDSNSNPLENVEVDLWTSEKFNGPPTAGYNITNSEGKVIFNVLEGEYFIGFNLENFPSEFLQPEKVEVEVRKGENFQIISLEKI